MDGDVLWSDGSSEERELEEERLYSLVYHSSETYDNAVNVASQPTDLEVRPRVYSKASRMNNVKRIIDYADRLNANPGSMQSGRKSSYFNNLSKDLSHLPRQGEVIMPSWRDNPMHTKSNKNTDVSNSTNHHLPPNCVDKSPKLLKSVSPKKILDNMRANPAVKKNTHVGLDSFSFNLLHHDLAAARFPLLGPTPRPSNNLFRLDDRLFTNKPANSPGEKLVSARVKVSKKQRKLNSKRRKLEQLALHVAAQDVEVVDVIKPVELLKNVIEDDVIVLDNYNDMETKYEMILQSKPPVPALVVNPEVIVLDSDGEEAALVSDSDESIFIVSLPLPPAPLVIAVEDSSEEEPMKQPEPVELKQPDLDPDHVDSSFDFLDSTYDMDGLAQSQSRLLSNLISNHSSRESLLDERLFEHSLSVASCSTHGPDLPNQDDNISSSTNNRSKSPPKQTAETASLIAPSKSTSLVAPSMFTSDGEDTATFKTPSKKVKMFSKSEFKKGSTESHVQFQTKVRKDVEAVVQSRSMLMSAKESRILDFINRRIAARKAVASNQVAVQSAVEVISVEEEESVEIVDKGRKRKGEDNVEAIVEIVNSGKKRKRKGENVVEDIVEIVDNETTSVKKRKVDDVVEIVDMERKRKGEYIDEDIVEIVDIGKKRKEEDIVEDIVAIHSGSKTRVSIENIIGKVGDHMEDTVNRKRRREELKKARKEGRVQMRKKRVELASRHQRSKLVVYTEILGDEYVAVATRRSPRSWTRDMRHFYNDSWGGENMDIRAIQQQMPGNPLMWRLNNADLDPLYVQYRKHKVKCHNCKQMGHTSYECSELVTITCVMCGGKGHKKERCRGGLCLQCGQPARGFIKECGECRGSRYADCPSCVYRHDRSQPCRDSPVRLVNRSATVSVSSRRPWNYGTRGSSQVRHY